MVNCNVIYLSHNSLSGSLPASLVNLVDLTILDVYNNMFSGSVPASLLSNAVGLEELRLGWNDFGGSLPDLSTFTYLEYVGFQ